MLCTLAFLFPTCVDVEDARLLILSDLAAGRFLDHSQREDGCVMEHPDENQ